MTYGRNNRMYALGRLKTGQMNKTEAAYAAHLEMRRRAGEIAWIKFEGVKLRLADNTFYSPDFAVMGADGVLEMHEVKGSLNYIQEDAKVKIKVAAEMYPFQFILVAPKPKKEGGGWDVKEIGNQT